MVGNETSRVPFTDWAVDQLTKPPSEYADGYVALRSTGRSATNAENSGTLAFRKGVLTVRGDGIRGRQEVLLSGLYGEWSKYLSLRWCVECKARVTGNFTHIPVL